MGSTSHAGQPSPRSRPIAEEIAEILQKEIIAGRFGPGQRIVEREVIERFGASSIPVREALQELEARGLLIRRHNVGCSVVQLTPIEAARICELRRTLEPKVMEWACERMTDSSAARIRVQLQKMEKAAARRQFPVFFQEDITFHRLIWQAADNPYATRSLDMIMGSLFASGLIGAQQKAAINLSEEVQKHQQLLEAICDRDSARAASALLGIAMEFEMHVFGTAA